MPSLQTPLKYATKGAETAIKVGAIVVGQAAKRVQSVFDREDRYVPVTPPAAAAKPSAPATPKKAATRPTGAGARISNPKAAKAVRKRTTAATAKTDAAAKKDTSTSSS